MGSSAGLLINCQRAGPKSLASSRRGSIAVRARWLVKFHSLQVTIKTNLLAELKHQAPNYFTYIGQTMTIKLNILAV